jgi:hypothetical protein
MYLYIVNYRIDLTVLALIFLLIHSLSGEAKWWREAERCVGITRGGTRQADNRSRIVSIQADRNEETFNWLLP